MSSIFDVPHHIRFNRKVDTEYGGDKKTEITHSLEGKHDPLLEMEHKFEPEEFEHKFCSEEHRRKIDEYHPWHQKNAKLIGNPLIISKNQQMASDDIADNIRIHYQ